MGIKLIVFDLDGTLVESRDTHYLAFNKALEQIDPKYKLTLKEHLSTYDGLPTTKKLELLTIKKGLPRECYQTVWSLKQQYTAEFVNTYTRDDRICTMLKGLKDRGFIIYIASNCTWNNLKLISLKKGFLEYVDWIASNEEVKNPKPSPEIYLQCMIRANLSPDQVLIIEDSPIGKTSALASGAYLLGVSSPADLSLLKVLSHVQSLSTMSLPDLKVEKKCTVVIPMAGYGSRFAKAGYSFPKPLIDIKGHTMIDVVVRNLGLDPNTAKFVFIVQKSHYDTYNLNDLLPTIAPGCEIVQVEGVTEGAACSVLLARQHFDNDTPLVIANSDQFVVWSSPLFFYQMENVDGGIVTFKSSHPKWSFAKLDDDGFVSEVAEKKPISDLATVGIYYYAKGSDFAKYADQMISKNIRVNNEFYVCPVFNEFIQDGKKIRVFNADEMWGLGTPEDLEYFLANYKGEV